MVIGQVWGRSKIVCGLKFTPEVKGITEPLKRNGIHYTQYIKYKYLDNSIRIDKQVELEAEKGQ